MRIDTEGLCKSFGGIEVLHGIELHDEVSTLAVIGPSGSGKSTLLRIIGGLIAPTSGSLAIGGKPVSFDERTLPAYRAHLGFVFQSNGLFHHLNARENIALPLRSVHNRPADEAQDRADALLERFGLRHEGDKRPAQLSGGQQQRVAIARAIAAKPDLLLLDEPTSALDPEYTSEMLDVINDLRRDQVRFIVVTHEMGFARNACDKIAFLKAGRLLEYGDSAGLFNSPATPDLRQFLSKLLEWRM